MKSLRERQFKLKFKIILPITSFIFLLEVAHGLADSENPTADFDRSPVVGPYSSQLDQLLPLLDSSLWKFLPPVHANRKISLSCYVTQESSSAVGVIQQMVISAPLEKVQKLIDNIDGYQPFFPGYKKIEILEKRGNQWLTNWEQRIPFPFPNLRYRMLYKIGSQGNLRFYRYQLTWSNQLRYSDGLIILDSLPENPQKTRYFEIDFWNTKSGIGNLVAPGRIRRESIEGLYISDRAIQIKAEETSLSNSEVQKKSKVELDSDEVEQCTQASQAFQPFWPWPVKQGGQ